MAYQFQYTGGVFKPNPQADEKFLLFFIVGGQEVSLHDALADNLVQKIGGRIDNAPQTYGVGSRHTSRYSAPIPDRVRSPQTFQTKIPYGKVFCSLQTYGKSRRYQSFYFEFQEGVVPLVKVVNFPGHTSAYSFQSGVRFLKKSEVSRLLDKESNSYKFVQRQTMLPVDTLKRMITVDKSILREGVRVIRVGARKKKKPKEVEKLIGEETEVKTSDDLLSEQELDRILTR